MTDKTFKHIVFGVCMIISCFTFSCVDNKEIAEILTEMESKPLKMCINEMPCYINGQDTIGYLPQDYKYLMVVNVDSSSCTVDGKLSIKDSTISGEYHKKKEYLVTIITKNCSGVQEGACCDQDKVGVEIKTTKI